MTFVGDLKNGRTVHSLVRILAKYDVKLNYISPESLKLPDSLKEEIQRSGAPQHEYTNILDVIGNTDVLYVTRIQKERFENIADYEKVKGQFVVNEQLMRKAKQHMIVMHPLPRNDEIAPEVDFDERCAYFRQMKYGLYVRMALLTLILGQ